MNVTILIRICRLDGMEVGENMLRSSSCMGFRSKELLTQVIHEFGLIEFTYM